MSQEELEQFLKENLKIKVYTSSTHINVTLYLGEEEICSAEDELDFIPRRNTWDE